jgi:thioredoxin-like negative regulator of GroEL
MKQMFTLAIVATMATSLCAAAADNSVTKFTKGTAKSGLAAFNQLIASSKPVVVKFGAEWCGPCKTVETPFKRMAESFQGKATFVKIDTDEFNDVSEAHSIRGIPAFGIFANGKLIGKIISGSTKMGDVQRALETYLANNK